MVPDPGFRTLVLSTATISVLLCVTLLLFPGLIWWLFAIEGDASGAFVARRTSTLFMGLATLCYLSRNAPPSPLRQAIAASIAVTMTALAALGLFEFLRGVAGPGIFLAIATEALLAMGFTKVAMSDRPARPFDGGDQP